MTHLGHARRSAARLAVTPRLPRAARSPGTAAPLSHRPTLQELAASPSAAAASPSDESPSYESRTQVRLLVRTAGLAALADIEAALNRMRLGCYGRCPSCDIAIELERLEILPMVALCMPCQREQESVHPPGHLPRSPTPHASSSPAVREARDTPQGGNHAQ